MTKLRQITHKAETAFDKAKFKVKDALNLFDPVIIYPYYGYGNSVKAYLTGRILEKERIIHDDEEPQDTFWNNVRQTWKRFESDEIPGVSVEGELFGITAKCESDEEGYFCLVFENLHQQQVDDGWHEVKLRITNMPFDLEYAEHATGSVMISHQRGDFGIISDVDDTIIQSKAMHSIKKLRTMVTKNSRSRVAFKGCDNLYRKLINDGRNPLFFVSGSSYNLYDLLVNFCDTNQIPKAPFLLRDLGLSPKQWIKQDTSKYKIEQIEHILMVYDRLSFICIGDSGQKDPEVYLEMYKKYPEQIKAIYIRHVHSDKRKKEVEQLAFETDIPFLVMENSTEAAEHAVKMGWIKG